MKKLTLSVIANTATMYAVLYLNFHQTANRAKGKKKTEQNKQTKKKKKTNTGKGIIYSHGGTGM